MKKEQLKQLIKEVAMDLEARIAGKVETRPGFRKVYKKGEGWVWVKQGDSIDTGLDTSSVSGESIDAVKSQLEKVVEENGGDEYKYMGAVHWYDKNNNQWNTLSMSDGMRKTPIAIVSKLLELTHTKEYENGGRETPNVNVWELFDSFKGKFNDIYAYPNIVDEIEYTKKTEPKFVDGEPVSEPKEIKFVQPSLLKVTNSLLPAKKDIKGMMKQLSIPSDVAGISGEEEPDVIDIEKEVDPTFKRASKQLPSDEMDWVSDELGRYDEIKKALKPIIKEMIDSQEERERKKRAGVLFKTVTSLGTIAPAKDGEKEEDFSHLAGGRGLKGVLRKDIKESSSTNFKPGDKVIGIMGVDGGYSGVVNRVSNERGKQVVYYTDNTGKMRNTLAFNLVLLNSPSGQSQLKFAGKSKNPNP